MDNGLSALTPLSPTGPSCPHRDCWRSLGDVGTNCAFVLLPALERASKGLSFPTEERKLFCQEWQRRTPAAPEEEEGTYMYPHMHTHKHSCTLCRTYAHTKTHLHACTHMPLHMDTHAQIQTHAHTQTYVHTVTQSHTCADTNAVIHAHTNTHTNAHTYVCTLLYI